MRICSVVDSIDCQSAHTDAPASSLVECWGCGDDVCRSCSSVISYRWKGQRRRIRCCFNCQDQRKIGRAASTDAKQPTTRRQCGTCPWRVDADPDREIPNGYCRKRHAGLRSTIADGPSLPTGVLHAMACHYSPVGKEYPCAGWLHNQLGPGNNIAVRLGVMTGRLPIPKVNGEQHERFEDTVPGAAGMSMVRCREV